MLTSLGFPGHLIPGILIALGIDRIVEAAGAAAPPAVTFGIGLAIPVIAAWRGSPVSAAVRPTDVVVRNRWRREVVPIGEVEAVEVGTSAPYSLLTFAMSADPDAMQPFLDALSATGHEVVDERPTITT